MMKNYDYIIAGGGASGMLLAYAMACDPSFNNRRILIIEKEPGIPPQRTWCFWENDTNEFEHLLSGSWGSLKVLDENTSLVLPIAPFSYKMLRSKDLFAFLNNKISKAPNIHFLNAEVTHLEDTGNRVVVSTNGAEYTAKKVFNSIFKKETLAGSKKPVLLQHFKGWFLQTEAPVFNAGTATLMDFSVPQSGNTRFMYVLPVSETEALVEYTLFSKELLPVETYDNAIKAYLEKEGITQYSITETEFGCIPMCAYPFYKNNTGNILHMGTAGGFTKAATGYTFKNIQRSIPLILEALKQHRSFTNMFKTNRFLWYDALLLEVLADENHLGSRLFVQLFKKNKPEKVLRFLDEQTSLREEAAIISSLPKIPFLKAMQRNMRK